MKLNQWTLGLAAVGMVSLGGVARAEEAAVPLMTALSSTTISGYVDASAHWNLGTGTGYNYYKFGGSSKADGFNLNVVQLSIAKPLDEADWAAGYKVDLWFGPDANSLGTQSTLSTGSGDFAIRQAYVALRAPVGNGLDFKVGVFDTILGYESIESGNNPNYTRSYAFTFQPQTHTGVLATYRFCECFSAAVGVANTVGAQINERAFVDGTKAESYKTYMGSIALTAPESWGFLSGSTLYAGVVNGFNDGATLAQGGLNGDGNQTSWYVGATMATPVTGLKLGAAWDLLDFHSDSGNQSLGDAWAASVYASFQATEKLSLHARGEMAQINSGRYFGTDNIQIWSLTGTVQYDLWKNVISRAEVRWDHGDENQYFSSANGSLKNVVLLAANIIYKF